MTAWWLGLAPVQSAVGCGGQTHLVRWEAGELVAVDHDDADGERALAALGGRRCECVDLLDKWQRHARDLRVLALASRGPGDILVGAGQPAATPRSGTVSTPPPVRPRGRPPGRPRGQLPGPAVADGELIELLSLGGGLPERLQAGVIAAWTRQLADAAGDTDANEATVAASAQLRAALYGRVHAGLRSWLGRADLELDLEMVDPGIASTLTRTDAGRLRAELPFGWLADVWSRGLANVMGRFCLDAQTADGRDWTLTTVGPALGRPEPIAVRLAGGAASGR